MWLNMLWWLSHITRIVMKLVPRAKKAGNSSIRPWDRETPDVAGSRRFSTSNVIAKAKTPSLKASVLAVSFAPRLSPFSIGRTRRHASGRFEGAVGPRGDSRYGPRRDAALPARVTKYGRRVPRPSERQVSALVGAPRGFKARVVSSRPLTPTTRAIEVEKPKTFAFRPTQFTFLQLKTEEGMDARPMSLATSPTRPHLEYAVRLSDSPYKRAFAALQPGDEVAVFGPIGDFVLHETRPAVLVAGGGGGTPLQSMGADGSAQKVFLPLPLLFSNRNEDEKLSLPQHPS